MPRSNVKNRCLGQHQGMPPSRCAIDKQSIDECLRDFFEQVYRAGYKVHQVEGRPGGGAVWSFTWPHSHLESWSTGKRPHFCKLVLHLGTPVLEQFSVHQTANRQSLPGASSSFGSSVRHDLSLVSFQALEKLFLERSRFVSGRCPYIGWRKSLSCFVLFTSAAVIQR